MKNLKSLKRNVIFHFHIFCFSFFYSHLRCVVLVTLRDIKQGEELFSNYYTIVNWINRFKTEKSCVNKTPRVYIKLHECFYIIEGCSFTIQKGSWRIVFPWKCCTLDCRGGDLTAYITMFSAVYCCRHRIAHKIKRKVLDMSFILLVCIVVCSCGSVLIFCHFSSHGPVRMTSLSWTIPQVILIVRSSC